MMKNWYDRAAAPDWALPCGYRWGVQIHASGEKAVYALEGGAVPAVAKIRSVDPNAPELASLDGLPFVMRPLHTLVQSRHCVEIFERALPAHQIAAGSVDEATELLRDIGEALVALEKVGMQHNDIKPSNILYIEGRGYHLGDFGAATPVGYYGKYRFGTDGYAAPEHLRGLMTDPRADQYSLAMTALRLMQGTREAFGFLAKEWLRLRGWPQNVSAASGMLKGVLEKALSYRAAARFPNAIAFHKAVLLCKEELEGEMLRVNG